jgi:hypothetical protein
MPGGTVGTYAVSDGTFGAVLSSVTVTSDWPASPESKACFFEDFYVYFSTLSHSCRHTGRRYIKVQGPQLQDHVFIKSSSIAGGAHCSQRCQNFMHVTPPPGTDLLGQCHVLKHACLSYYGMAPHMAWHHTWHGTTHESVQACS